MRKDTLNNWGFEYLPILRKIFLVILFLSTYIYAQVLPMDWSWENGPLEMAQNFLLATGFLLMLVYARRTAETELRQFWFWLLPVWLLLLGRELSWGRIFFPTHVGPEGPVFLAKSQLPLGNLINPIIGLIILVVLVMFVRYRIYRVILNLFKERLFPFFETSLFVLAAVLSYLGEKMPQSFFCGRGALVEELCELVAYTSLLLICADIRWKKQFSQKGGKPRTGSGTAPHISSSPGN